MEQNQNYNAEATENPRPVQDVEGDEAYSIPREATIREKWNFYSQNIQATIQEFMSRLKKPVDTIYAVGIERYQEGDVEDAAVRFRFVSRFRKNNPDVWYLLGSSEMMLGNLQPAAEAFLQALALRPTHEEALYRLAVVAPERVGVGQMPRYVPLSIAVELADIDAIDYDNVHLMELGYRGHETTFAAVNRYLNPDYQNFRLLDLGCGTGLVGLLFRSRAAWIEGVDISANMLSVAESRRDELARRIYDAVHQNDLRRFLLEQQANSYDIVTAANVFAYLGGLTPVFDGVKHVLKPGGIFSFSIEPLAGSDFTLQAATGRFVHSEEYIREQAARAGLDVLEVLPFEMYFEEEAMQYVLRKPVAGEMPAAPPPPAAPTGE